MANSFDLSVNVRNANPSANIDFYYGTYESVAEACASVPKVVRMIGKTVGIVQNGSIEEYWWKSGIEDSDLVLKSGAQIIIDNTFAEEHTGLNTSGSFTILKNTHNKGDNPIVQCYLNNSLIILDISSQNGDITVSWIDREISQSDVLTIVIVSADYTYEIGENETALVPLSQAGLTSQRPFMQCWWQDSLVTVDMSLTIEGNVIINVDEEIAEQITDSNKLVFVAADNVYVTSTEIDSMIGSYTITEATHGMGKLPLVQCWIDNELIIAKAEISNGDVTINWKIDEPAYIGESLYITVCNELVDKESVDLTDLLVIGEKNEGDGGITPTVEVGGIEKGKFINKDTFVNKLLRNMLVPSINPIVGQPSATIETSATTVQRLLEVGDSIQTSILIDFNRGNITLDGTVQGNTAGPAIKYIFSDGVTTIDNGTDNSIEPVVQKDSEGFVTYTGSVSYTEGDQPKDSEGNNYGSRMPAGTMNTSNSVSFEFVYPIYANTDINSLSTTYKQPLVGKSRKYIEIAFPLQHGGLTDRYTFEVPSTINVVDIKYYNSFAIRYEPENRLNDFKCVSTDKNGVAYKRYTYKNGSYMEDNMFKIIWE